MAPAQEHDEHDQDRPAQVELLLDRERPEVLQRGGRIPLVEILGAFHGEPVVEAIERGEDPVDGDRPDLQGRGPDASSDHGGHHDRHGRGQQPANPAGVEGGQRPDAVLADRLQQQARDQETGDHEEDVDADEPSVYAEQIGVVQHHGQHREGPQPLDVRPELGRPGRVPANMPTGGGALRSPRSPQGASHQRAVLRSRVWVGAGGRVLAAARSCRRWRLPTRPTAAPPVAASATTESARCTRATVMAIAVVVWECSAAIITASRTPRPAGAKTARNPTTQDRE